MGGHGRTAGQDVADCVQEFGPRGALEHVTRGAGRQSVEDVLCVFVDRQHKHLNLRLGLFELAHAFDTVHTGKIDIHQHHVGCVLRECFQRCFRVGVTADAAESLGAVDDAGQGRSDLFAVFDDRNFDIHVALVVSDERARVNQSPHDPGAFQTA